MAQVVPQTLPEQTEPAAQARPHAPQLALSLRVSTSQPLAGFRSQSRKPVAQAATAHAPATHVEVALDSAQTRPQAPQFATLVPRSISQPLPAVPSQSPKPPVHRTTVHAPDAQPLAATRASAQTVPHAPQLAGSLAVLAQNVAGAVPQVRSGAAQVVPQMPPEHTRPAAQAVVHAPQLALSVRVLTSQPSDGLALQSAKPAAHVTRVQTPALQAEVALGSAQVRPHAPQLAIVVWVLVSQPLAAVPSQSPKPAAHPTTVQTPAAQPPAATFGSAQTAPHPPQCAGLFAVLAQKAAGADPQVARGEAQVVLHAPPEQTEPAAQARPQAPQLVLSERVSTSQPSAGLVLQSAKPAVQAVIAHVPAVQADTALARTHARPHAPQLVALALRSVSQPLSAAPSQSPKPPAHRTTVQAPAAQPLAVTWDSAQTVPHAPQLAGSMAALAQNAPAPAPQVRRGEAQVAPHPPPEQTWPARQAVPQAPQLALSVRVSTSQPLAGSRSQSAKPAAQAATTHAPAVQAEVALGRAHTRPHAPQLVASALSSVSHPSVAAPSQSPKPPAQRTTVHAPVAQPWAAAWASAQTVPHAPQLAGSMAALAQ